MPYISRKKYKSRRERYYHSTRTLKVAVSAALIIALILAYFNRIWIKDIIVTSFY